MVTRTTMWTKTLPNTAVMLAVIGSLLIGPTVAANVGATAEATASPAADCKDSNTPPETWSQKPAKGKSTGYEVDTGRGTIHLRHGYRSDGAHPGALPYTWAAVKNPANENHYVKLEVDTTGNKVADDCDYHLISHTQWTWKRLETDAEHMRACVVADFGPCNANYATAWWPVN